MRLSRFGAGLARGKRAPLLFGAAVVAVAVALVIAVASTNSNPVPDVTIPPYWHEIEEGEATRADIRRRLGKPSRVEGSCLYYDEVVDYTAYRFCFRDGVLNLKAAY